MGEPDVIVTQISGLCSHVLLFVPAVYMYRWRHTRVVEMIRAWRMLGVAVVAPNRMLRKSSSEKMLSEWG